MRADGIWIVTVASGAVRRLTSASGGSGATLDWSPNGRQLLFAMNSSIVAVASADGALTTLVPPPPYTLGPHCSVSITTPTWSPNGQLIAYQRDDRCSPGSANPFDVLSIGVTGADGNSKPGVDGPGAGADAYDLGSWLFTWSPDSHSLAYIDDEQSSAGDAFLATTPLSPTVIRRLKRIASQAAPYGERETPAWQPLPPH